MSKKKFHIPKKKKKENTITIKQEDLPKKRNFQENSGTKVIETKKGKKGYDRNREKRKMRDEI